MNENKLLTQKKNRLVVAGCKGSKNNKSAQDYKRMLKVSEVGVANGKMRDSLRCRDPS